MKYIVEFEDEPCMYEDEVHFYKCIQAPWWGLSERVIKQLTPYQPDAPDTNVGNITNLCAHENDLISRQAAIDEIRKCRFVVDAIDKIRGLPSVQPDLSGYSYRFWKSAYETGKAEARAERKHGKWIYGEHDVSMCDGYRCDKCGFFVPWDYQHKSIDFINDYHFCPSCGADMRGGIDGGSGI